MCVPAGQLAAGIYWQSGLGQDSNEASVGVPYKYSKSELFIILVRSCLEGSTSEHVALLAERLAPKAADMLLHSPFVVHADQGGSLLQLDRHLLCACTVQRREDQKESSARKEIYQQRAKPKVPSM